MENITLGDIANVLVFIAGFLVNGGIVAKFAVKNMTKVVKEELKPIDAKLDTLEKQIHQVDIDNTKNYLQQTISEVTAGAKLDQAGKERFYENYDHYTNDLHLNSWVHKEVERLEKEGKL